jgi:dihydrofolate reductase
MTLDGVIQSSPENNFKYEGWFFGYTDEACGAVIQERLAKPVDLLLGRKTFDIWEPYWTHPLGLVAKRDDRNKVRRLEYT